LFHQSYVETDSFRHQIESVAACGALQVSVIASRIASTARRSCSAVIQNAGIKTMTSRIGRVSNP
jgi:hypothetical protein